MVILNGFYYLAHRPAILSAILDRTLQFLAVEMRSCPPHGILACHSMGQAQRWWARHAVWHARPIICMAGGWVMTLRMVGVWALLCCWGSVGAPTPTPMGVHCVHRRAGTLKPKASRPVLVLVVIPEIQIMARPAGCSKIYRNSGRSAYDPGIFCRHPTNLYNIFNN